MPRRGIGALRQAIEDFIDTSPLGEFIHALRVRFVEGIEKETAQVTLRDLLDDIPLDGVPSEYRRLIDLMKRGDQQGAAMMVMGSALGLAFGMFGGLTRPISRRFEQGAELKVHSGLLTPYEAAILNRRGLISNEQADLILELNGFFPSDQRAFEELGRRLIDPSDIIRLLYRNPSERQRYITKLVEEGFNTSDVESMIAAGEYFPGVQDLILFAVREVFTPEIAERYGQFEEFPEEFASRAALLGLSPENARLYWGAHWRNPAITTGFEMLHRLRPGESDNPVTRDDVRDLIKIHDITPYWRDRLIDISYSPITRVDLRRLFRDGVIDEERVFKGYLDIGYNETNAQLLTEWTVRQYSPEERDLTRSAIQQGFKLGLLTEGEALEALSDIGYDTLQSQFYLSLTSAQLELSETEEQLDYFEFLYLEGEISEQELLNRLNSLNLSTEIIRRTVDILNIRRRKRVKLPSLSQLEDFYREDIISADEYRIELQKKNYLAANIEQIIQHTDILEARQRMKDAEAAEKERERIEAAAFTSEIRRRKAEIDVDIAELNVEIADLKVATHETDNADELEAIKLRIDELKADIADLRVDKALVAVEGA